jgi:hypothetical protein
MCKYELLWLSETAYCQHDTGALGTDFGEATTPSLMTYLR